jgi:hypothetical protein
VVPGAGRHLAIRSGADARFMKTSRVLAHLAGDRADRTWDRPPADWYPLFPNPVVTESLLDRLINNSHQVFMNGPSYRPNKAPGRVVPTGKTSGN